MKTKIIIALILMGVFLAGTALGSLLSEQKIWNNVWDESASKIRITGV